ncbi:ABC transporter permease [Cryobacterium breve]|uniref:ABC transporter permease n=1 Tax=Cryobacterium breve TaxID=1259258 RepID=UPI00248A9348|nr:ABC transporter permease [Cryobacterium breve]
MKFLDIVRSAIQNSFRNKLRTGLTVVAIFIGAFTLTITSGVGTGVTAYINGQVSAIGAADVLTITKAADATATASDGPAAYDPSKSTTVSLGNGSRPGSTIQALTTADLAKIKATAGILSVDPAVRVSPDYVEYAGNGKFELTVSQTGTITTADLAAGAQLDNSRLERPASPADDLPRQPRLRKRTGRRRHEGQHRDHRLHRNPADRRGHRRRRAERDAPRHRRRPQPEPRRPPAHRRGRR